MSVRPEDIDLGWIVTESGNKLNRNGLKLHGTQHIVLAGKTIIHRDCTIRGDLRSPAQELERSRSAVGRANHSSSTGDHVSVTIGRYSLLGAGVEMRPPHIVSSTGLKVYHPQRIGQFVHVGAGSIVECSSIGDGVRIGKRCILGNFSIIRDGVIIENDTIVPPRSFVTSFSRCYGQPAEIEEINEGTLQMLEAHARKYYAEFQTRPA